MRDFELEEDDDEPVERTARRGAEDDEQAEWLAGAFERGIRYDHTARRWHIWNGVRWAPDKTKDVQRRTMDLARERLYRVAENGQLSKTRRDVLEKQYRKLLDVNATERALTALSTRAEYKTDGADWDQDPNLLGCENGVVDLRVNALVERPGPEMLVTRSTGLRFEPFEPPDNDLVAHMTAWSPKFMKFLLEITSGDIQLALFYVMWFGYSLFGHTREQKFLILTGLGRNGKGALVTAMRHAFGEYGAPADQNLYMRSKFGSSRSDAARADLMELKGRRLAVMSEPDGGAFNEEMLKAHTGGDPITARALYSNNVITWVPTHSITFLTNQPPSVSDIGPAMAARVMVADFKERFEGDREDKQLYSKLEAEGERILGLLCFAARAWHLSERGLVLPERVRRASEEYLTSNDPIGRALSEAFVIERGAQAYGRALYDAYVDWHARSDQEGEPMTLTAFGLALAKRGFRKRQARAGTVYEDIRPKSAVNLADETDEE